MRTLLVCLALFVALKIWVQDSVYRSATHEALIAAYRSRAEAACAATGQPSGASAAAKWPGTEEPRVVIGKASIPVRIWDIDSDLWKARFQHAYLVLDGGSAAGICTYDPIADTAEISRS